jgi:hypothetical protein
MTDKQLIEQQNYKIDVQDRLIESLLEYVRVISPVEPKHITNHRRAANYLINGTESEEQV